MLAEPSPLPSLWHALAQARLANESLSQLEEPTPIEYEDVLVWHIPAAIDHPLRCFVGTPEFYLLSAPTSPAVDLDGVLNWSADPLQPLAYEDGRYRLSQLSTSLTADAAATRPLVLAAVTTPRAPRGTVYLGLRYPASPQDLPSVLSVDLRAVCSASRTITPTKLVLSREGAEALIHRSRPVDRAGAPPHVACRARYYLVGGPLYTPAAIPTDLTPSTSTVYVEAAWDVPTGQLAEPLHIGGPPLSAHVTLDVFSFPGQIDRETHAVLEGLLGELQYLMIWNGILQGYLDWPTVPGDPGKQAAGAVSPAFVTRVDHFFSELAPEDGRDMDKDIPATVGPGEEADPNLPDLFYQLPARKDQDFTERFWQLCQTAQSQADLTEAISALAEHLEAGKLKLVVDKANPSSLARVIRDFIKLSQMETVPDYQEQRDRLASTLDYWMEQPLEILVEIGLYKLRLDYCFHLIGHHFATHQQLEYYLDGQVSHAEQLTRLRQLHRCLEVWALIKVQVHLFPYESLRQIVGALLTFFSRPSGGEDRSDAVDESDGAEDDESQETTRDPRIDRPLRLRIVMPRFSNGTNTMMENLVTSHDFTEWSVVYRQGGSPAGSNAACRSSQTHFFLTKDTSILPRAPQVADASDNENPDLHLSPFSNLLHDNLAEAPAGLETDEDLGLAMGSGMVGRYLLLQAIVGE
ncbi:hypothetical protein IWQ60_002358 [Tieghemiomyces parasiticus]|uniref:Uncharacterized protein n=1 Tax=Tieghemiomyces parasiticus TaxID=78921 RepID=A0A9W8E145_9FUNG|nr:hypothetical protein IWQ60_002358 [Tieghemiomyces parasiticus]